ncbi:MAG TPA: hypothetical protein VJZ76_12990 [Thermoanaerobaculia bacterium]|nr:hypothetical protein [Thermoanaerobaculia bacterium]
MRLSLALVFVAVTAHAQIVLGPERIVGQPRFSGPGASEAAVATSNGETVAVVHAGVGGSLYLQRLGAGAQPLTEHGVLLARDVRALGGIASNGNGYVVFWLGDRSTWSLHVGAGGELSAPQLVAATANAITFPAIASNGKDYLAAWTDTTASTNQAMAARLDGDGKPLGNPFPLSERRNNAEVSALASDGHDYLAAVERFDGTNALTTLVPVSGDGTVGSGADLSVFLRGLVHTTDGYIGFWSEGNGTRAVAVDPSGVRGPVAAPSEGNFMGAVSNGADAMVISFLLSGATAATRIRRNGVNIETVDKPKLMVQPFSQVVAGATPAGEFFTISLKSPIGVAPVAAPERPLLTFPTPQELPAISGNVVIWREGLIVRAARIGTDAPPLDVAPVAFSDNASGIAPSPFGSAHVVASNGNRALIAWTELRRAGEAGMLFPMLLKACTLNADGTLSPPLTIATGSSGLFDVDPLFLGAATATSTGFAVVWQTRDGSHVARLDANGNVTGTTAIETAIAPALARRGDDFLMLYRDAHGNLVASAGAKQTIATAVTAHDLAADGSGHFLAVFAKDEQLWSQLLDENGAPAGTAQPLGAGSSARVTWTGAAFVVVAGTEMAIVAADGRVLAPLLPALTAPAIPAGNLLVSVHSAIDTGLGDEPVVFVRSFSLTPARRRAARP